MRSRASHHLDPNSPFVVDTRDLGRRAGSMREIHRDLTAPDTWALELVRVAAGAPVALYLRLESVMDGVYLSGTVSAPVSAECGRCLDPISLELEAPLQELFGYQPDPEDADAPVLDGDLIALEGLLRDAVVLALPLNPVCDPDCPGLCPGCGARLAEVGPDHHHDEIDPRWAALSALTSGPNSDTASPPSPNPDDNGGSTPAETPIEET